MISEIPRNTRILAALVANALDMVMMVAVMLTMMLEMAVLEGGGEGGECGGPGGNGGVFVDPGAISQDKQAAGAVTSSP